MIATVMWHSLCFEDQETIRFKEHDYELMVDVLVHNETYEKLCD